MTDDRHPVMSENLEQVAKRPGVAAKRVIGVSGRVRLAVSEQVRSDHRVGAREDGNHFPPGERVLKQAVHQNEGWTAAGDPVHQAMTVQEHLVACDAGKVDRSSRTATLREAGSVAAS